MPELPEVETVKRTLAPHLVGREILGVEIYVPAMIKYPSVEDFTEKIKGCVVDSLVRRGKYLTINFTGGLRLITHLRMTGALIATDTEEAPKHTRIKFTLSGGKFLWFTDIRKFGTLYLVEKGEQVVPGLLTIGPEPTEEDLTLEYLEKTLQKKKAPVKSVLLDQSIIAGIGNIYADEALFVAGLRPDRKADTLTKEEISKLREAVIKVIRQGIENRGTTFSDYRDGEGKKGSNQNHLLAYGRAGKPCKLCGTALEKSQVAGRSTSFCPQCQK